VLAVTACLLLAAPAARGEPVAVAHREGLAHGFIALRSLDGETLASGDLVQIPRGSRVTATLRFRFKDGSLREETTVYTQRGSFHMVRNHIVQRGPAFKTQLESTIEEDGRITVRYSEDGGEEKVIRERMKLPPDVANGLTLAVLKNLEGRSKKAKVSMVAITPKPRLVELELEAGGEERFDAAGVEHEATHWVIKVHVPGITGAIASVLGKIPPDSHVWVARGDAPTFVKAELQLAFGGPTWRLELASPTWPPAPPPAPQAPQAADGREQPADTGHGGG
jgi:hypothetical protein